MSKVKMPVYPVHGMAKVKVDILRQKAEEYAEAIVACLPAVSPWHSAIEKVRESFLVGASAIAEAENAGGGPCECDRLAARVKELEGELAKFTSPLPMWPVSVLFIGGPRDGQEELMAIRPEKITVQRGVYGGVDWPCDTIYKHGVFRGKYHFYADQSWPDDRIKSRMRVEVG